MRIAQLSSNMESVPPSGYGGTELVVSMLTEGLVARGHDVTLFATGDSKTSARLISCVEKPLRTDADVPARRWQAFDIRQLLTLQAMRGQFDVVHNHMGWQALPYLEGLASVVVTTNHNPIKSYAAPIYLAFKKLPYVSISDSYRRLNYGDELNYVATVYNGIDVDAFDYPESARKRLLFIGRICHDKGTAEAVEIAARLNLPLVLAGKVDAADERYFEERIKPRLQPGKVEFIGEVNHDQKRKLYHESIAVLYPINFDEPFGLVMAEALACGTPLLAFNRGSVAEVLSDGETALIGTDVDDLIRKFARIGTLSPEACKQRVREKFSGERMVDAYEQLYEKLLAGDKLTTEAACPTRR